MFRTRTRIMSPGAAFAAAFSLAVGSAAAQTDPGDPGPLPRPRPYFGTKTLGNPPVQYPAPGTPAPDPVTYWKGRIISSGGYGSPAIILINNTAPCYVPAYYFGSGYYSGVTISYRARIGNFGLGLQQYTGYPPSYWGGGYVYGGGGGVYVGGPVVYGGGVYTDHERPHPDGMRSDNSASSRPSTRTRPKPRAGEEEANDYYLHRKPEPPSPLEKDPALAEAVRDIESAFRSRNISLLERHVVPSDKIVLQAQGRTRRSIAASDYLRMTEEALKVMKTAHYTLSQVEPGSKGSWMVYGRHVLRGEDGAEKVFNIGFVLKKRGETWVIAEVSADPSR